MVPLLVVLNLGVIVISFVFEERRKKNRPIWIDRRIADKSPALVEASKETHFKKSFLFGVILALVIILNLFDLVFTLVAIPAGAKEMNPLMAYLFERNQVGLVIFFKVGIVSMATFVLWYFRYFRITWRLTVFATLFYSGLFLYHLFGLSVILTAV